MKLFYKRWKSELSKRKPENLTLARAIACNETVVNQWFVMLEKWLVELEITCRPEQIYNADESGFNTDPAAVDKVFCRRGAKNSVRIIGGSGKECYTVLECCNAMGDFIPPYILYKAQNLYTEWCVNGPTDAGFNITESGWMEEHAFYAWICHFVKNVEHVPRPILLLYDGHGSHVSYRILRKAVENGITILKLPPHTSHVLQPLDMLVCSGQQKLLGERYLTSSLSSLTLALLVRLSFRAF